MYIILAVDHGAYEDPKDSTSHAFFTEVAPFNDLTITSWKNDEPSHLAILSTIDLRE